MTWAEICADKRLQDLPFRIESDRWGNIVMSPPPRSDHAEFQGLINQMLGAMLKNGIAITECPLQTPEGVKAIDVAWISRMRRDSRPHRPTYLIAPELCVEILSPSNTSDEIEFRKRLFFEKGAVEFWVCDEDGRMSFFDAAGELPSSKLCPSFPSSVEV